MLGRGDATVRISDSGHGDCRPFASLRASACLVARNDGVRGFGAFVLVAGLPEGREVLFTAPQGL